MIQCKDPFELLEYVSPIRYGIINTSNNKILENPPDLNFHSEAPVTLPDKTFENGYGTCWEVSIIFYQQLLHMPNVDNIQCIYLERGKYGTDFFHNHFAIAFQYNGKHYSVENFGGAQGGLRGPYPNRNTVIDTLFHANDYSPERKWTFINSDYPIEKLIDKANPLNIIYAKDIINLSYGPSSFKTKTNNEIKTTKLNKFIGKETLGKVNINQENFLKFLNDNDNNMPLDEIFEEINSLVGVKTINENNQMPPQQNINNQNQQIRESLNKELADAKARYEQIVARAKQISKKRNLTPEEIETIRQAEIELNEKILAESRAIRGDLQDPNKINQIAENPRAYAMQHPTSIGSIPKEQREEVAPEPSMLSKGKNLGFSAGMQCLGMLQGAIVQTVVGAVLIQPVMKILGNAYSFASTWMKKTIVGNEGENIIKHKQTEVIKMKNEGGKEIEVWVSKVRDQYYNELPTEYTIPPGPDSTDGKPQILTGNDAKPLITAISNAEKSGKIAKTPIPEPQVETSLEKFEKGGSNTLTGAFSWLGPGQPYLKWGMFAVLLAIFAWLICKILNRRNRKAREAQLKKIKEAQQNRQQQPQQESLDVITTDILCEYFEEDAEYFKHCDAFDEWCENNDKELALLSESVFGAIGNMMKSDPKVKMLNDIKKTDNKINKGIESSVMLAEANLFAAKNKTITPIFIKFSRGIVGLLNNYNPLGKVYTNKSMANIAKLIKEQKSNNQGIKA